MFEQLYGYWNHEKNSSPARSYLLAAPFPEKMASSLNPAKGIKALREAGEMQRNALSRADLERALQKCSEALHYFEQVGGISGKAAMLHQTGIIYSKMGQHSKAIEIHKESLRLWKSLGDKACQRGVLPALAQDQGRMGRH